MTEEGTLARPAQSAPAIDAGTDAAINPPPPQPPQLLLSLGPSPPWLNETHSPHLPPLDTPEIFPAF